jgi:hypothetical protein
MVGVLLLFALFIVIYLVDRFGPRRNLTRGTNVLRAREIPAAIATRRGVGLAILDLALVGVLLALFPRHYWLIIFWGIPQLRGNTHSLCAQVQSTQWVT